MAYIRLLQPGIDEVEKKRDEFGWSRGSLANQAHLSRATVESLCKGKNVLTKNCEKIFKALELKLKDLEEGQHYEREKKVRDDKRINNRTKQKKPISSLDFIDQSNDNYCSETGKSSTKAVQPKKFYINPETILALKSQGLIIEEEGLFRSPAKIHDNSRIFWPIVPAIAPNLIHAVFVRYLRLLVKSGLSLIIFIFDEYYEALQGSPKGTHKKQIEMFVDTLINMGFQEINPQIIFQSEINESPQESVNLIRTMLTYFASIKQHDFGHFSKPNQHELEKNSLLRFLKPVFNMLYLQLTGDQYGFILAGYDEQPNWLTYQRIAERQGSINPVKLYIPIMRGCNGGQTNVMDRIQNISTLDSEDDLLAKCLSTLKSGVKDNPIFYVLKYVYFAEGKQFSVINIKKPGENLIKNLDELLNLADELLNLDSEAGDETEIKNLALAITKELQHIINGSIYTSR